MEHIPNVLASRYASKPMKAIWSAEGRVGLERDYWIAVLRAQKDLGLQIPQEAIEAYERTKDTIDLDSIKNREAVTRHDVKARKTISRGIRRRCAATCHCRSLQAVSVWPVGN